MRRIAAPWLALTLTFALPAGADTLKLPDTSAQPSEAGLSLNLPARGMSKARVESSLGAPRERLPAVGEPPISRWKYDAYTVYFEGDYVIHSVVHERL